ncbi:protein tyrosine kinase [Nitzschia inconspicua]|uniref:Protein tyrosine kinase n=1 Tax=Nitzschia inconspicua TaxID=303405 RepID=A0A9K3KVA4_9STRA|nr:protein tyrosine kinase [Nitzschia inconspicua]
MNQGMNLIPPVGAGDYVLSQSHSAGHHGAAHHGSAQANHSGGQPVVEDPRLIRSVPSTTTSSSSPPPSEYSSRQIQPQQIQQQHIRPPPPSQQHLHLSPPPRIPPGPLHGGANGIIDDGFSRGSTATATSLPWTVGTTDGSFATMTIMQQQQQRQQQQEGNRSSSGDTKNGAGGVTIGAAGEANQLHGNHNPSSSPSNDNSLAALATIQAGRSLYHDRLFHQSSSSVESILTSSCDVMGFDIAEMWLRTGPKTHQLTNSHLRPTALEDSVRKDLVEVYYGEKSNERTHRLSPALCKRAKDANDVVWVTAYTQHGAEALRMSISNVRTAVAVPVCHELSNTNITIIYFSIRRIVMTPAAVEFLVHMSLCAAVASVNSLAEDGLIDRPLGSIGKGMTSSSPSPNSTSTTLSRSEHVGANDAAQAATIHYHRADRTSITGAKLDLQWRQLQNVEYLTDGGNSWIHTAVFNGKPVVVKTLKPECQDVALAINEIEAELNVHSRLNHPNIVSLIGAGLTSKGVRFIVLERLDGGTLTQMLGYDTRIRDRRRRFWRKKQLAYLEVLRCARSLANAMHYCHEEAIPGSMVLHRDLKPDNLGFTIDGTLKLLDFGLARIVENADAKSNELYAMSGETGSLRYMAPEVAEGLPYNHKADVYSFGIILWELNAGKKPFVGLNRESFYERIVHGGERPPLNKKWPAELCQIIKSCWNVDVESRPTFGEIVEMMDSLLSKEKAGGKGRGRLGRISGLIDRHSTWF